MQESTKVLRELRSHQPTTLGESTLDRFKSLSTWPLRTRHPLEESLPVYLLAVGQSCLLNAFWFPRGLQTVPSGFSPSALPAAD